MSDWMEQLAKNAGPGSALLAIALSIAALIRTMGEEKNSGDTQKRNRSSIIRGCIAGRFPRLLEVLCLLTIIGVVVGYVLLNDRREFREIVILIVIIAVFLVGSLAVVVVFECISRLLEHLIEKRTSNPREA